MKPAFAYLRFYFKTIAIAAVLMAVAVSATAQERNYPALFGNGNGNSENRTSPRFGISYNTRDFELVSDKRLNKSLRWLDNHGMSHMGSDLESFAFTIRQPDQIGHWIDSAYEQQRDRRIACGGKAADEARRFNPRSLRVSVVARPFKLYYQGQWVWAGGSYDPSSRQIKVVVAAPVGMDTPRQAYLSKLPDWIVSEMSRVFFGSSDPNSPCQ